MNKEIFDQAGLYYPGELLPEDQRITGRYSGADHPPRGSSVEAAGAVVADGTGTPHDLAGHRPWYSDRPGG